ncbi:ABC transporter substrate-binding protein [Actinomycetospora sp. NBRC 106378]|uniref:ABC transporter substrate-binding protein n=1 Tax=Actinomycetospora sp. NBRC 106378 TaxID=3032208 RepID=UPI0024A43A54|nr:ABC transporter substrate-binding protein [Actinomycetospora sp. NBRC 106378]GLZ54319.1 hypothetical protein Acsp07_39360 [Actinomycetospora sp. NBRC 106378]
MSVLSPRRRAGIAALVAAAGLALSACSGGAESGGSATTGPSPVKLSFEWTCEGNWPIAFLGRDKGFFAEQNLDVQWTRGQGGSSTVPLIAADEQDLGVLSAPAVVLGAGQGLPVTVVGVAATTSPVNIYADPSITSPKQLEGRTVAVQTDQFEGAVWSAFVTANGIDASKVNVVQSTDASTVEFLDRGIDAIVAFGPTPSSLELTRRAGGVTVMKAQDTVPTYGHTLVASNRFLQRDPDAVKRFEQAWAKATAYAVAHPDEALAELRTNCTELDADKAKYTLDQYLAAYSAGASQGYLAFDPQGLDRTKDVLVRAGLMQDTDLSEFSSRDYLPSPAVTGVAS